jgi:mono/diheme cytochrome c family protein
MRRIVVTVCSAALLLASTALAEKPDKKTERLWASKCASCHGKDGKGQTDKGKQMKVSDYSSADWQKKIKDEDIKKAINDGVKKEKDGAKQEMDAYSKELKPDQIDALVGMVRSLGG